MAALHDDIVLSRALDPSGPGGDPEVDRLLHWFFDGDPPGDLADSTLCATCVGPLLHRGPAHAGYDPGMRMTNGSRSGG